MQSNQVSAGLIKEHRFFSRTKRLLGALIAVAVIAVMDPLFLSAMPAFTEWYDGVLGDLEEQANIDMGFSMQETMGGLFEEMTASTGVTSGVANQSQIVLILLLVLLVPIAGGEQKKRSIVMPYCAGLTPAGYILPKFVYYNVLAFCAGIFGVAASAIASSLAFATNDLSVGAVLAAGVLLGLYYAFLVSIQMCVGICTGKPGLTAGGVAVVALLIAPALLTALRVADKYNPFALPTFASTAISADAAGKSLFDAFTVANVFSTIVIAVALIAVMYLVTLFGQSAQRVDNSGNDLLL